MPANILDTGIDLKMEDKWLVTNQTEGQLLGWEYSNMVEKLGAQRKIQLLDKLMGVYWQ